MASGQGYTGLLDQNDFGADMNAWAFIVSSLLSRVNTATLVEVLSCTNDGTDDPVGTVNVKMLINQIDGNGVGTPNPQLYRLPYLRYQGGTDAIIIDPKPRDIGLAVFASRDTSAVKATKAQANPGSRRWFDLADGIYLGGMLNGTPTQYIRFHEDGIYVVTPWNLTGTVGGNTELDVQGTTVVNSQGAVTIQCPVSITMDTPVTYFTGVIAVSNTRHVAGGSKIHGDVELVDGSLTVDVGAIVALANDVTAETISLINHVHSGVIPGGGDTGKPVP